MISVSNHPRDKAFIAALYDTGAKLGEIVSAKMKHINFDNYVEQIIINRKTGMHRVQIIFAVSYLSSWLAIHPGRHNPEAHVWVAIGTMKQDQPMKYESHRMLLKHAAQRAGIKKDQISFNIKEKKMTPEG